MGEFVWRPLPQRPARTTLIVFLPPSFDFLFRLFERAEPMRVQTFNPQCLVEGLDESVVGRFPWISLDVGVCKTFQELLAIAIPFSVTHRPANNSRKVPT